ncbi:sigma factor-like helix-turn-helix DNA-binding protein [Alkalihalobacillus deserti]
MKLLYGMDDGQERTYKEVSRVFNISRQSIRNNELKAIEKIIKYI